MPLTEEERKAAYSKKYRERNRAKIYAQQKAWREKNNDKVKLYRVEYAKENKEALSEKGRRYRAANRDKANARSKAHYKENKGKWLSYSLEWRKKNRVKYLDAKKKLSKKRIDNMDDIYIKELLTNHGSILTFDSIPQSLIEAKRLELQMKRYIKEQENGS